MALKRTKRGYSPMPYRFKRLADYNTRVSEGIVHTPEYVAEMAELQDEFNLLYQSDPHAIYLKGES